VTAAARRPADGALAARVAADESPRLDAGGVALPDEYGCACVLLLLRERPSSGHELGERLRPLGFVAPGPDALSRTLCRLEWIGLVRACGGGEDGSATTYHVTAAGAERLGAVAGDLRATSALVGWFLARCGEHLVHRVTRVL
jgi:DNA-binding PadR family transcriptional regulator